MRLILCRHGNTFNSGDKVVRIGSTIDLPLVESGRDQARAVGKALLQTQLKIDRILCSKLSRTREFGEIIIREARLPLALETDARLNELDYGRWTNRSESEIVDEFGQPMLEAWNKLGVWPTTAGWGGSEESSIKEVASLVHELSADQKSTGNVMLISSNGKLRYFLRLIPGEFERRAQRGELSVGTGRISILENQNGTWEVRAWNIPAQALDLPCS